MNTLDGTTLKGVTDGVNCRVAWEGSLEIDKELVVFGKRVVGVKVSNGWEGSSLQVISLNSSYEIRKSLVFRLQTIDLILLTKCRK